jgi:hypothetical protein
VVVEKIAKAVVILLFAVLVVRAFADRGPLTPEAPRPAAGAQATASPHERS